MKTVLVTGAGGFLGLALTKLLISKGIKVHALIRRDNAELSALGVVIFKGDLIDYQAIENAAQGCDTVFHVASKAGVWGAEADYIASNITGTKHVLEVCFDLGIPRLIYTSTPSVIFSGQDENGVNESTPYSAHPLNHYTSTKIAAEKMVLAANGFELKTTSLRPHLIWGPGDPHLVPRVISKAKQGRLALVGKQDKLVDTVYIDNAALAHYQAACELESEAKCAGKAYFISNDEPVTMAAMLNGILSAAHLAPVSKRVPAGVAYSLGLFLEGAYGLLGIKQEPVMTRFVARQLSTAHWFDISPAKTDFAYQPKVSLAEGMVKLETWLANNK
ncbi:NAD-dependent epimerase/dehydratase family protein [Motilimonas cestriensis]|uniref:NAD-dependent epimerase/dehydratase family protein n=1 Tax=Motilimonas cestriensis TaxID=2742685 RepID=A0ABS8WDM6_9GAMM|nr:NAD-dependent epimerase/dehydratase family protein [Motilimonas cestriensis]MCE2597149.1 NAD-dependent epimerase/dehydratase family protein [Motilimonas cestriensis]